MLALHFRILAKVINRNFQQMLSLCTLTSTFASIDITNSILLSCSVKLVSSSQIFSPSDIKGFLAGSISNGFSTFNCLIVLSSISEELPASETDFEQFFYISLLINFVSLFEDVGSIFFPYMFLLINIFICTWWCKTEWRI